MTVAIMRRASWVGALFAAASTLVLSGYPARAQSGAQATPTPGLPCPSMMNVHTGPIDPSLSVTLTATLNEATGEVILQWMMSGPSKCAWIQPRPQGYEYPAFADFIHPPGPGMRAVRPIGQPGEFCWRVFAVSDIGHSEPAEACVQVEHPSGPRPIVDGPFPTPPPGPVIAGPNCPAYLDLGAVPLDPTLGLTLDASWDDEDRGIALTWSMPEHARCAWFQFKRPNSTYAGFEERPWADFILAPGNGSRVMPAGGSGGEYCYRLWTFSTVGHSEPAEACLELDAGKFPTPPPPGSHPPTPDLPPAPANVLLAGRFVLTDAGGNPLPWEQQTWFAGISWEAIPGFSGVYQVERARMDSPFAHGFGPVPTGLVPAESVSFGRLESVEQFTPGTSWCFRVRAVVQGRYSGRPSEEVCTPEVPERQAEPAPAAPLPPDAGNTRSAGSSSSAVRLIPLVLAIVGFLLARTLRGHTS